MSDSLSTRPSLSGELLTWSTIDTDAELNAKIENHRQSLDDARAEREATKTKHSDEQDSMAAYERKRSQAQTSHGRLQALKQVLDTFALFES